MNFDWNPSFRNDVERAVERGMSDVLRDTKRDVERGLSPATIVSKSPVVTEGPQREVNGDVSAVVKYGRGLGPIYESGTKQRRTRRGHNRGAITTQNNAMRRAREAAIRRGLDLRRYL